MLYFLRCQQKFATQIKTERRTKIGDRTIFFLDRIDGMNRTADCADQRRLETRLFRVLELEAPNDAVQEFPVDDAHHYNRIPLYEVEDSEFT